MFVVLVDSRGLPWGNLSFAWQCTIPLSFLSEFSPISSYVSCKDRAVETQVQLWQSQWLFLLFDKCLSAIEALRSCWAMHVLWTSFDNAIAEESACIFARTLPCWNLQPNNIPRCWPSSSSKLFEAFLEGISLQSSCEENRGKEYANTNTKKKI